MKVCFTPVEMYQILHYASVIAETKRINSSKGDVINRRYSKDIDDFGMHLIGCMGEAAVHAALEIPYKVDVTKFGDDGNDILVYDVSIQVKTLSRAMFGGNLLYVNDIEKVKSDVLVSTVITGPSSVEILGAISKEKFKRVMFNNNFGYGNRHCVNQKDLSDMNALSKHVYGDEWE
ncbi:hypothetical protein UFOVP236_73 [uncultured Caudovirales phage]|uniref:Uncharacterized protein n=1 Tax=uncultured Caudovirales phage TaxID=2100421 RepID=A0A6J7WUG0_9CAUD|nr:hypothetical protein UFOVP236_73 [uncultured Caudovirales phage]